MNLGVSLIPFDQVGLAQRISVGLRSRIELHGIFEIIDSTIDDVISRLAESSQSFICRHNGIASVAAHGRVAWVKLYCLIQVGETLPISFKGTPRVLRCDPSRYQAKPR